MHIALLAAALCLAWATPALAGLHAERIGDARYEALRVGGPDADGGVGDWALGNGTICAVVSDPAHESPLHEQGGMLVDLGNCGREDDQWSVLQPMLNLARSKLIPAHEIRAERDAREARLVVDGSLPGVREQTTYAVDLDAPAELRISTRITRTGPGDRVFALANVILHANGQLRPFTLATHDLAHSVGFQHPAADPDAPLSLIRAVGSADTHVLVGGDEAGPGIAYGVQVRRAELLAPKGARALPILSLSGKSYTMLGVFSRPFWIAGDPPGLLQLGQIPFMDLDVGETMVFERAILVSRSADVASVTDLIFQGGTRVSGHVDDPRARMHFSLASGAPITEARPDAEGHFSVRLPRGSYRLRALTPEGQVRERSFRCEGQAITLAALAFDPAAKLRLPRGRTVKLIFHGVEGTPDPVFGDDLLGFRVGEDAVRTSLQTRSVSLAATALDPSEIALPSGHYIVYATRGIEYEAAKIALSIAAGETRDLEVPPLRKVVASPGWINADLHVHSAESFDSALPLDRQLVAFAANGGEVVVSTEHDRVIDPRPTLRRLGLGDRLAGMVGVEITSAYHGGESPYTLGHWNAFPLVYRRSAYRGGAPAAEGRRPRDLAAELHPEPGPPILQLNHPLGNDGSLKDLRYLTHLAVSGKPYVPTEPLAGADNHFIIDPDPKTGLRDFDFQAVELMNGSSMQGYRLVRADWLSWLLQGERRTGTANSDSHRLGEIPALPRNYVQLTDDDPAHFDEAAFRESIRAGRVFGTTGPFLEVSLSGVGLGGTFRGADAVLHAAVRAASWVPISALRVYVNGVLVERRSPLPHHADLEIPLHFDRDAFVTVEVQGSASGMYAQIAPGFEPLAFTNPIFVDANDDGEWSALGLDPTLDTLRP